MGDLSNIEWTDATFNPWRGCTKVSLGCRNCYAETLSGRNPKVLGIWGENGTRPVASEAYWAKPLKWNAEAERDGVRRRVFCASLADVFEDRDDLHPHRLRLLDLIRQTPHLDWLLLTKRPENIHASIQVAVVTLRNEAEADPLTYRGDLDTWLTRWLLGNPPANVWLGTSVENQATADERIPHLLRVPAVVRFLSCEPLLGPVDLHEWTTSVEDVVYGDEVVGSAEVPYNHGISWVIVGGESGAKARPMHPAWARSLRDQCGAAGVPFFFKQWGEWAPRVPGSTEKGTPHQHVMADGSKYFPGNFASTLQTMYRVGKKAAGSLLDGREHKAWPEVVR